MGGSSSQVTGYRYFTNLLLFIGNPIEKKEVCEISMNLS